MTDVMPRGDGLHFVPSASGCYGDRVRSSHEPGLLSVFRLIAAGATFFLAATSLVFGLQEAPVHPVSVMAVMRVASASVLAYLLTPVFERGLGRAFLPLGIVLLSLVPIAGQVAATRYVTEDVTRLNVEISFFLFFPLLLIAWQYGFRVVVGFSVLSTAVEAGFVHLSHPADGASAFEAVHTTFLRSVAFLVVGYLIARLVKEQRAQRSALSRANAELTHYAATLERLAVTRERNRVARELHDTLAHTLSGIAVLLEGARSVWESEPASARSMLDQSLTAARSGLNETRRALQALRASPLEDLGLLGALRSLVNGGGTPVELRLPERLEELPPDVEQTLFRVAQEGIANAARHAQARVIELSVTTADGSLTLQVQDDGRGFRPDDVAEGSFGLRGLRERAELIGGTLVIDTGSTGTRVLLSVPVSRRRPS